MEYLVICDLTFKEVTPTLHCNGTMRGLTLTCEASCETLENEPPGETFTT